MCGSAIWRRPILLAIVLFSGLLGVACGSESVAPQPPALLEVVINKYGDGRDADGFDFSVGSKVTRVDSRTQTLTIPLSIGSYSVSLLGLAENCERVISDGTIRLRLGVTTRVQVDIRCHGRFAFTFWENGATGLYYMADTGEINRVVGPEVDLESVSWSPSGALIALALDAGTGFDIYTVKADGSQLTRITDHPAPDVEPSWSPRGDEIAFIRQQGAASEIFVIGADGSAPRSIAPVRPTSWTYGPTWSPRGDQIVFTSGGGSLFAVTPDGRTLRTLMPIDTVVTPVGYFLKPVWAPDGSGLAVGTVKGTSRVLYHISDGFARWSPLADTPNGQLYPSWSPNGEKVLFVKDVDGKSVVHLVERETGSQTSLSHDHWVGLYPAWATDGSHAYFMGTQPAFGGGNLGAIMAVDLDGSGMLPLTPNTGAAERVYPRPRISVP